MNNPERAALGRERVGKPIATVVEAFLPRIMSSELGGDVDPETVVGYVQGFLLSGFVQLVDEATSEGESLESIEPAGVKQTVVLLLRDILARARRDPHGDLEEYDARCDSFVAEICDDLAVDAEPVLAQTFPLDTSDLQARWAADAMAWLGLPEKTGLMLVVGHASFADEDW